MRFTILQQREDLKQVFIETLRQFYVSYFQEPNIDVRWVNRFDFSNELRGEHCFYTVLRLNLSAQIYHKNAILYPILNEYKYPPQDTSFLRIYLNYFYVLLATSIVGRVVFADHKLLVVNSKIKTKREEFFIVGGKTRFRFFFSHEGHNIVYLKAGYPIKVVRNEILFRKTYAFGYIPKLLEYDQGFRFYKEEIVKGSALNRKTRLPTESVIDDFIIEVIKDLNAIGVQYSDFDSFKKIKKSFFVRLLQMPISDKTVTLAQKIIDNMVIQPQKCTRIKTCYSHGDFQRGNVLYDNEMGKFWVIDWESLNKRINVYDYWTYILKTREKSAEDWLELFAFGGRAIINDEMYWFCLDKSLSIDMKKIYIQAFMLEELCYCIDDLLMIEVGSVGYEESIDKLNVLMNNYLQLVRSKG